MKNTWKKIAPYVISIAIALGVGALSAYLTKDKMQEYAALNQPPLAPPGWLFPVVWTVLFVLMGIAAALVWKSDAPTRSDALVIYGTQLVVNFLWSIFYFNFNARLLAFFWLIFLLLLVILMTSKFAKISPTAAKLQIPYILWLLFAGYLNLATYLLNR